MRVTKRNKRGSMARQKKGMVRLEREGEGERESVVCVKEGQRESTARLLL